MESFGNKLRNLRLHVFFISNTFISNWYWLKIKQNQSNTLWLNFFFLKIIHILHTRYRSKMMGHILKSKQKNKCVCIHEALRLIIMKMKMKMKKRSLRYGKNKRRSRHGHKYSKYKTCMMMLICVKQLFSNTWSSIHEKVKQHWGWIEKKSVAYKKISFFGYFFTQTEKISPTFTQQNLQKRFFTWARGVKLP